MPVGHSPRLGGVFLSHGRTAGSSNSPTFREEVFSETAPVAVNRTDPNEHESVVMRPDLEAKVP
jgi:hypothetical protein